MKTAATLIHALALLVCLSAYLAMSHEVAISGVRRAIQTIAATVEMPAAAITAAAALPDNALDAG